MDNCFERHHRNMVNISYMFLLCRVRTSIGEYCSNLGEGDTGR